MTKEEMRALAEETSKKIPMDDDGVTNFVDQNAAAHLILKALERVEREIFLGVTSIVIPEGSVFPVTELEPIRFVPNEPVKKNIEREPVYDTKDK